MPSTDIVLAGVPAGLTARPLQPDDARAVFELILESEQHDLGHPMIELPEIEADWSQPSFDLANQSIGYFEGDRIVAYAQLARNRVEAGVRPDARGRGVGTSLVRWWIDKARELGFERVGQTVIGTNQDAIALFRSFGAEWLYSSWILGLPESAGLQPQPLPAGYLIRQADFDSEAADVHRVIEDAFNEWPNRQPTTLEDWVAFAIRSDFETWQILVATYGDAGHQHIVGVVKVTAVDGEGWIEQIAVRRDHRGRGLGRALLVAAFDTAHAHGATSFRLNTDTRTGALGLYEHVGMVVVETFEHYSVALEDTV